MHHWVVLAARWWAKMRALAERGEHARLAYNVWVDDIRLTLRGCTHSWTYFLLHTMEQLGVVSGQWRAPGATVEDIMALALDSEVIAAYLRWQACSLTAGKRYCTAQTIKRMHPWTPELPQVTASI